MPTRKSINQPKRSPARTNRVGRSSVLGVAGCAFATALGGVSEGNALAAENPGSTDELSAPKREWAVSLRWENDTFADRIASTPTESRWPFRTPARVGWIHLRTGCRGVKVAARWVTRWHRGCSHPKTNYSSPWPGSASGWAIGAFKPRSPTFSGARNSRARRTTRSSAHSPSATSSDRNPKH